MARSNAHRSTSSSGEGTPPEETTPPTADSETGDTNLIEAAHIPPNDPGSPKMGPVEPGGSAFGSSSVVEVQFRPNATGLAVTLAMGAQGLLQGAALGAAAPGGQALQDVLLRHNLEDSTP